MSTDTKRTGRTRNDEEALRLYDLLRKQREAGTLPAAAAVDGGFRLPRVRLATDVDTSKAKPSCRRCHGTGLRGNRVLQDGEQQIRVPIVCRCVTRRGGVRPDALNRLLGRPGPGLCD